MKPCRRCRGLLIVEPIRSGIWWLRCVQCGARLDRVILRNRRLCRPIPWVSAARLTAERAFQGAG